MINAILPDLEYPFAFYLLLIGRHVPTSFAPLDMLLGYVTKLPFNYLMKFLVLNGICLIRMPL